MTFPERRSAIRPPSRYLAPSLEEGAKAALSPDLRAAYTACRAARHRTVWDARGLLAPYRNRLLAFRLEDGQYPDALRWGVYEDVIHAPHLGYALVVRGLMKERDRARRRTHRHHRERTTLPLGLIAGLPAPFLFLAESPSLWVLPEPFVACPCGVASTGRFCTACGAKVRQKAGAYLGEGFIALQSALRALQAEDPTAAAPCRCGAYRGAGERHCTKCRAGAVG
jgi:hypothetical protein